MTSTLEVLLYVVIFLGFGFLILTKFLDWYARHFIIEGLDGESLAMMIIIYKAAAYMEMSGEFKTESGEFDFRKFSMFILAEIKRAPVSGAQRAAMLARAEADLLSIKAGK